VTDLPVVVVGAGSVGLSTALFLARRGIEPIVVERNATIGQDAASGSAGYITPSHCMPLAGPAVIKRMPSMMLGRGMISVKPRLDPALLRFGIATVRAGRGPLAWAGMRALLEQARASRELFAEFAADRPELEFRRAGLMNVCATAKGMRALREEVRLLGSEGLIGRVLNGAEAAAMEPALRDDVAGAVFWEEDASIAPDGAIAALAEAAKAAGASLRLGRPVSDFTRTADGAVSIVHAGGESIPCGGVVLAAGSGTRTLGEILGLRIPVQAGKGHHIDILDFAPAPRIPMIFHEHAMGAGPLGGGIRLTGGMDFVGDDPGIDQRRIDSILRLNRSYLREAARFANVTDMIPWAGMRPCTPDGLPIVGRLRRAPNAVVATGHGMLGFTLGPATGRDVAELVSGVRLGPGNSTWQPQFAPARYGL
jgi:D-amino-acid dehydrogenase